ncbi:MAG: 50S ribosomal protein L17 [Cyanobacteria bacterium HKST-UBA06]|nr:50S ribosomal protein L17 [Cyanobacteria bacterium HKST-UBA05]MCA9798102.1 50S ribosomal protein L17 [Cyanobacteria bacterium HKST-UBA04]MCA9807412.1 50S ribosomal protein L17 [Cyanobacteria bacterium HKST-UBA06]MCA9841792.1 50S ribosomal protein L17 [Cyanobacteria bacterium HKST-UBA03]
MRHKCKRHLLGRPADQRKAMLRSLATNFIKSSHHEIVTTQSRAKALQPILERLMTLAKRGDVHAIRQAGRVVYNHSTGEALKSHNGKLIELTVLRKLFQQIAPKVANRQSGFTRIVKMPPRRGDAAPMALIQLVDH